MVVPAALFGILFQALIPLVHIVSFTSNGANPANQLVICTSYGIKTIDVITGAEVLDGQGAPDGDDVPDDLTECSICLAGAISLNALSNTCETNPLYTSSQSVAFTLSPLNIFHVWHLTDAHGARAPPIA